MKILFSLTGKVINGKKRGKSLGFPTANIEIKERIPEGIYASYVTIAKKNYPAATFIGSSKTFNESDYKAESFIINFNEDIYGKWITVNLLKKIRNNKKFTSEEKLVGQMEKDKHKIIKFFSKKAFNLPPFLLVF